MNNIRLTLASTLATICAGWAMLATAPTMAQSAPKPAAVISIADLEQTLGDLDYLVDASGFGQMKFMIQTQVTHFLRGVDKSKPSGVLLYMDEGAEQPSALGFIPVEDLDDLLDTLAGFAEVDEGDDYTTIITDDDKEILVKQVGAHAFVTDKPEMFERIPDDPAAQLGDLPTRFNFAARVFGQRIPQSLRDKAMTMIRDAYDQQLEELQDDDEGSAQAELQQKSYEMNMKQIKDLIQETDQLAIGMTADEENQTLTTEVEIIGTDDSALAKRAVANMTPEASRFAGFMLPGAVFNAVSRSRITQDDIDQYVQMAGTGTDSIVTKINEESDLSEDQLAAVEKAIDGLSAVFLDTLKEGVADAGAVAELVKGNINFAMGTLAADPAKIEQVAKDLAAEFEGTLSELGSVKLNADSHKGVTLHTFTMDTPANTEEAVEALGDQIQVVIGAGKTEAYLALGSDPIPLLKRAIDGTGAEAVAPTLGIYNVYIAPMLSFGSELQDGPPMLRPMADRLVENGRDRLQYQLKAIKNGFSVRMDLQDGFMELIQVATEAMGQAQGGGNF